MEIGAVPQGSDGTRKISPTDLSQYIRLDQCARYLRLRLYGRNVGARFMRTYDVVPQSIPPTLTQSGRAFEERIEQQVARRFWKVNFVGDMAHAGNREHDNERVIRFARELVAGETVVLFQPRLDVVLNGWDIRGDVDILRMERSADAMLHILITDMKASTTAKVEHRLQVALYGEMLATLFGANGVEHQVIRLSILYRGPAVDAVEESSPEDRAERREQQEAAERLFAVDDALLELVSDPESYRNAVEDVLTSENSAAIRAATAPFSEVPFHLTYKCDGCMFNEFCMKWAAEHDDLSLLPHITAEEKSALRRADIATVAEMARLKELRAPSHPGPRRPTGRVTRLGALEGQGGDEADSSEGLELVAAAGKEELVRTLSSTWPVGPHLDELVIRARRYRAFKGDDIRSLPFIPSKGYGSLPYSDARQNPNLVRVYIDAQHDYLQDRIYMLGALVVASEGGVEPAFRRRGIVHSADGPPDTPEREEALLLRFIEDLMRAVTELAAPDAEGKPQAPIHLIFYNHFDQRLLLDALARHFEAILTATPLYDFVTQSAAFDSPIATFLDAEIRALKNYPMTCQSLQAVAAFLKFDWNTPEPYRDVFRTRMFDFWRKWDVPPAHETPWYTRRARFNSQIPLEYAYAAWGELPLPRHGTRDEFAPYRRATVPLLRGFHTRRLQALEHVAKDFRGNERTEKRMFDLPDLATFEAKAPTLAHAIDEFVTVERHVVLNDWKTVRLAPPERRVLMGETLLARFHEADQEPEIAERNRENIKRKALKDRYTAEWRERHPDAKRVTLPKEQKAECDWSQQGMRIRLRLETADTDCDLDGLLALSRFREGESLVIFERTTIDTRLPAEDRVPFTPTPRQMLYGMRCTIRSLHVDRDAAGKAQSGWIEIEMSGYRAAAARGFAFAVVDERPLVDGEVYTLDGDPNDWYGSWTGKISEELCAREDASPGGNNALYDRLARPGETHATWPPAAADAQQRFMDGFDALQRAGAMDPFEPGKRCYIASYGDAPTLLVQGPPGTGKSYSTAFAAFARLQGAIAAGIEYRVFLTCKTHAATDVLLKKTIEAQDMLRRWQGEHPDLFARYFESRLLTMPLFRMQPRGDVPAGVIRLGKKSDRQPGEPVAADAVAGERYAVVAITPGGTHRLLKDRWEKDLFGHPICSCLVLDEASQMNLPEAVMAALPLKADGHLIVVGDHRQMPPIVKHDWAGERGRTFAEFRSYESLFLALLPLEPPMVKFEESFRLHADMAEFLREEIYRHDDIPYFSRRHETLPPAHHVDPFVAAVLRPEHTIVVVVHDEAASLLSNPLEARLMAPVLEALAAPPYALDARHGLGVVVPHRAQRALLQETVPELTEHDPRSGIVTVSAVDTVERFQGDERTAIMVSATESDRDYLLLSSEFLLDPRRLTVALSRAKRKMILVASRSVFSLFSADEAVFERSQLWKNLLRKTSTELVWEGEREGTRVQVWGNAAPSHDGVL